MSPHHSTIKVFSGNSNPELAADIAARLSVPLSSAEVSRFSDGEISVQLKESVRGFDVFIVQSTCAPVNRHLMARAQVVSRPLYRITVTLARTER